MVWLSNPLGASAAVLEDIAQPSSTKPRAKRAAENIVAFFIRPSSQCVSSINRMSYHTGPLSRRPEVPSLLRLGGGNKKAACEQAAFAVFPFLRSFFFCLVSSSACNYFGLITPNVPARL